MFLSRFISLPLLSAAILLGGCANNIRLDTLAETQIEREKASSALEIETDTGSLVTAPLIKVSIQQSEVFKVKTFESKTKYDVVTPYQGWRELYEVPMGIVLFPFALLVNIVDVCLFGMLPDRVTDAVTDVGFAGLNPAMNIESESRSKREELNKDKRLLDEKQELLKKPLANHPLQVSSAAARMEVMLDDHGKAEVSMVRLSALTSSIDRVTLAAKTQDADISKDIDVSRQLRAQLDKSREISLKYTHLAEKDPTAEDVQALDFDSFVADLIALSKLGFESESLRIEKRATSLMSEEQKSVFNAAMDKAINAGQTPASL